MANDFTRQFQLLLGRAVLLRAWRHLRATEGNEEAMELLRIAGKKP